MMFTLPKLPYKYDALEPYIDAKTMEIHHTKHHQTYVDKLNGIVEANSDFKDKKLEELVLLPETKNMAGGHYNHSFLWEILTPPSDQQGSSAFEVYKDQFIDKSLKLFGSGWVWLAKKDEKIEVIATPLQDSPLVYGYTPILGIDLWEHAYYIKHMWNRAEYINDFLKVVNWQKVNENL